MIWLGLFAVFLIAETLTVSLVSMWFAAGSLVAMFAAMLGAPIWLQITLFFVVSAALLACLRPIVRKYVKPRVVATNVDSIIGSQGYVTVAVDNLSSAGQVKLNGMEWTARSTSGTIIEVGTLVRVDRIEGVKVFVTPAEVPADVK